MAAPCAAEIPDPARGLGMKGGDAHAARGDCGEDQAIAVRQTGERDSEAGETESYRNQPGRGSPIRQQSEQRLRHRRKKRLCEHQPRRRGVAQMIGRDKKRQHGRHYALIDVVGEMAGGKQCDRFVVGRFSLGRGGRYFGRGTHESLYLAEDRDSGKRTHPRSARPVRIRNELVLRPADRFGNVTVSANCRIKREVRVRHALGTMDANKATDLTPLAERWLRDFNEAPWRRYIRALEERGRLAEVDGIMVDAATLFETRFRCDTRTCAGIDRSPGIESCCTDYDVEITPKSTRESSRRATR